MRMFSFYVALSCALATFLMPVSFAQEYVNEDGVLDAFNTRAFNSSLVPQFLQAPLAFAPLRRPPPRQVGTRTKPQHGRQACGSKRPNGLQLLLCQ